MGWADILANDVQSGLQHSTIALGLTVELGTPFPEGLNRLVRAQLLYLSGDTEEAKANLRRALTIARAMNSAELEIFAHFLQAEWALGEGYKETAHEALAKAIGLARKVGYINAALWQPSMLERLCAEALSAGIEIDYVRWLIRKRRLAPPLLDVENWPWPIRIFCLGQFSLMVNDRPIRFGRKSQRRPLDLLKVLIAHGGHTVPEAVLTDSLWPDAEADAAHEAYTTAIYRLRKLLGDERTVTRREGALSLNPHHCWVDVWAFERLLDNPTNQNLIKALTLYKGAFLANEPDPSWALRMREHLRNKFLHCIAKLGTAWENLGEYEQAIDCYQKGLEADALAELLYQRLMRIYLRQDRRAEAIAVYERCQTVLRNQYGISPSRSTRDILHLLRGES